MKVWLRLVASTVEQNCTAIFPGEPRFRPRGFCPRIWPATNFGRVRFLGLLGPSFVLRLSRGTISFLPLSEPSFAEKELPRDLTEQEWLLPRPARHFRVVPQPASIPTLPPYRRQAEKRMNWILNLQLPCIGTVERRGRYYPNRCDPPGPGWRQGARYHRVPPGDVRNRVWIHVGFFSFPKFERFLVRTAPFRHRHVSYVSLSTGFHRAVRAG
ncbi:hypothetical protein BJX68DRAFT_58396 [Aspergillus pseudodeflectus]|uniref:Uncharacterized protein n=1 Tax=Aspergillus pseudodeflectus TaxID=176178 RepID=A0ABR4KKH0_9EURO